MGGDIGASHAVVIVLSLSLSLSRLHTYCLPALTETAVAVSGVFYPGRNTRARGVIGGGGGDDILLLERAWKTERECVDREHVDRVIPSVGGIHFE